VVAKPVKDQGGCLEAEFVTQAANTFLDSRGIRRLHAILELLLLRRTKDQRLENGLPIVSLPPKSISLRVLDFSPAEHDMYQSLWLGAKTQFRYVAS
jgi:SNF2 family DNA or RNA helicase